MKKKYVPGLVVALIALCVAGFVAANSASDKAGTKAVKGLNTSANHENTTNKKTDDNKKNDTTSTASTTSDSTQSAGVNYDTEGGVPADQRVANGRGSSNYFAVASQPSGSNDSASYGSVSNLGGQGGGDQNVTPAPAPTPVPAPAPAPAPAPTPTPTPAPTGFVYNPVAQGTGFTGGRVSLTFDDGLYCVWENALPLLHQYNFKSTQYLISDTLKNNANYGTGNCSGVNDTYMTLAEAQDFYSADKGVVGTELAAHTMYHCSLVSSSTTDDPTYCLTNLNATDQATQNQRELVQARADLRSMFNLNGQALFSFNDLASPYGAYDAASISEIKADGYASHRSTDGGFNAFGTLDPYNLLVFNVGTTTPVSQIEQAVSDATTYNEWLILVFHDVDNTAANQPIGAYGISSADLNTVFQYIQNQTTNVGLKVVTVGEALAENALAGTTPQETVTTAPTDTTSTDTTPAPQTTNTTTNADSVVAPTLVQSTAPATTTPPSTTTTTTTPTTPDQSGTAPTTTGTTNQSTTTPAQTPVDTTTTTTPTTSTASL